MTFDSTEIVRKETDSPFIGFVGSAVLQSMGLALGFFDHFAVGETSLGPVRREMVGIEFVQTFVAAGWADDDAFAAFVAESGHIDRSTERVHAANKREVAHAFGVRCDLRRKGDKLAAFGFQTVYYDIFEASRHALYMVE